MVFEHCKGQVVAPLCMGMISSVVVCTVEFYHVNSNSHRKYATGIDAGGLRYCHFTERLSRLLYICRYVVKLLFGRLCRSATKSFSFGVWWRQRFESIE